jgi:hypothetical protein
MNLNFIMDGIHIQGRSILRAWHPGVLQHYMAQERTLWAAEKLAFRHLAFESVVNNLVVTTGKQLVGDILVDVESTGLTYHAIGTGTATPAIGNTQLGAEVKRKVWTARSRSGPSVDLSVFYLAAESTYYIKEAGVFGGSTASSTANSGTLFSRYLQSYDNSGGTYDLTFDYTVTFS